MNNEEEGSKKQEKGKNWVGELGAIIVGITTPLHLFALVVGLSVYILPNSAVVQKLTEPHEFDVIMSILGLLFGTLIVVAFLTFFRPRHLSAEMAKALEQSEKALRISEQVQDVIQDVGFKEAIAEIVEQSVLSKASSVIEPLRGEGNKS